MEKTYNTKDAAKAQEAYCNEHQIPLFAPRDGWCSACSANIYRLYSVEEARSRHITRCPFCSRSFSD